MDSSAQSPAIRSHMRACPNSASAALRSSKCDGAASLMRQAWHSPDNCKVRALPIRESTDPGGDNHDASNRLVDIRYGRIAGSMRPRHDRHGGERVGRRTVDDLGADGEIDERVVRLVEHAINPRRLEEDAGLLAEHLGLVGQLRQIDIDRTDLPALDRKIRRVFVEAERLAPAAFARLRDVADDA